MASWKTSIFSKVGRLTRVKYVGSSIPAYSMVAVPLPKKTYSDVDATLRYFWQEKTKDKKQGGHQRARKQYALQNGAVIWVCKELKTQTKPSL